MARRDMTFDQRLLAQRVSQSLDDVVAGLVGADNAEAFVAALEMNGAVWKEIQAYSPLMGWGVSSKTVDFALTASRRARHGIDDHAVEAIITINRRVAGKIGEAFSP